MSVCEVGNQQLTVEDKLRIVLQMLQEEGGKLVCQAMLLEDKICGPTPKPAEPCIDMNYPNDMHDLASAIRAQLEHVLQDAANALHRAHTGIGQFAVAPPATKCCNDVQRR